MSLDTAYNSADRIRAKRMRYSESRTGKKGTLCASLLIKTAIICCIYLWSDFLSES